MPLLDGFGVLDTEFGGRSDVPQLDFGIVPALADEKDEYRKTDNEIQGALVEATELWVPANRTGRIRARLGTFAYLSYVGGQSSEYSVLVWRPEDLEPTEDSSSDFGGFGWVAQTAALKENISQWFVMGHADTGLRDADTSAQIELDSGVHLSSFATEGNRPEIFMSFRHEDTVPTIRTADISFGMYADLRGKIEGVSTYMFRFRRATSDQTLTTATTTVIVFNSGGTHGHDQDDDYNEATGVYTVPSAGFYRFESGLIFGSNAVGLRSVGIRVNGTVVAQTLTPAISTTSLYVATGVLNVSAGDTVDVVGRQESGGNLGVLNNLATFFSGHRAVDV